MIYIVYIWRPQVPKIPIGFQNYLIFSNIFGHTFRQWIGLRENVQENPIFNGKIYGFL